MDRPKTLGIIVFDAIAYCLRETKKRSLSMRGVIISLVAGVVMSSFYAFVWWAMTRPDEVGPCLTFTAPGCHVVYPE